MPFVRREGEEGLFFVPEDHGAKKHPCDDCHSCQWCADERCVLCLKRCGKVCSGNVKDIKQNEKK